jgi:hypothetical protein
MTICVNVISGVVSGICMEMCGLVYVVDVEFAPE